MPLSCHEKNDTDVESITSISSCGIILVQWQMAIDRISKIYIYSQLGSTPAPCDPVKDKRLQIMDGKKAKLARSLFFQIDFLFKLSCWLQPFPQFM